MRIFLTLTLFIITYCDRVAGDTLAVKDFMKDVQCYADFVDEVHADPYRLISKRDFGQKVEQLKHRLQGMEKDTIARIDCYFHLQELTALIRDGHTQVLFPFALLDDFGLLFPFALKVISDKVYISEAWGKEEIPLFAELLEINGVSIEEIKTESSRFFCTSLAHGRDRLFEMFFHIYLAAYFDLRAPWRVKYTQNFRVQEKEIMGISVKDFYRKASEDPQYRVSYLTVKGRSVPVLEIPSFAYGSDSEYRRFIDSFFEKHKDAVHLIIDLRRNNGGSGSWGYYLLDYLADSEYRLFTGFDIKVSDPFRNSVYLYKAGNRLKGVKNGAFLESVEEKTRIPHETVNRFKGRTFLLVSHATFSAGVGTAAIFKFNGMGTVVGRETLGRKRMCSDPVLLELPHSKLSVQIPTAIYTLPGKNPDRGVIPDEKVTFTLEDHRDGRDRDMEKVMELISAERE